MKILMSIFLIILISNSSLVKAEIVVIVNHGNNSTISKDEIARIFLGKIKHFPGGDIAIPIIQPKENSSAEKFNISVIKKSSSQLSAYWSKKIFTGQGTPPQEVSSDEGIIDLVAKNPSTIGYVEASKVTSKVKVIARY